MQLRYKTTGFKTSGTRWNPHATAEVLTGDDTVPIGDLDVWLTGKQVWKDMRQAFKDRDVISNNTNTWFDEPTKQEDRDRGYFL